VFLKDIKDARAIRTRILECEINSDGRRRCFDLERRS
jgi:hypothetical protein